MKKVLFVVGLFLSAVNSYAGVCSNGSLTGNYNYNISSIDGHSVGRISFNGKGGASFSGIESVSGTAWSVAGSGTYAVTADCKATGTIVWTSGYRTTYWLFLDQMDAAPAVSVAYHANIILKSTAGPFQFRHARSGHWQVLINPHIPAYTEY